MKRKDTFNVTTLVDGVGNLGTCRMQDGADVEADKSAVRPGGMAGEIKLGGPNSRNSATIRYWNNEQIDAITPALERANGGARVTIKRQPLDANKNPVGRLRTFTGVLTNVKPPEYDADSNDAAELEIEVDLDEDAT